MRNIKLEIGTKSDPDQIKFLTIAQNAAMINLVVLMQVDDSRTKSFTFKSLVFPSPNTQQQSEMAIAVFLCGQTSQLSSRQVRDLTQMTANSLANAYAVRAKIWNKSFVYKLGRSPREFKITTVEMQNTGATWLPQNCNFVQIPILWQGNEEAETGVQQTRSKQEKGIGRRDQLSKFNLSDGYNSIQMIECKVTNEFLLTKAMSVMMTSLCDRRCFCGNVAKRSGFRLWMIRNLCRFNAQLKFAGKFLYNGLLDLDTQTPKACFRILLSQLESQECRLCPPELWKESVWGLSSTMQNKDFKFHWAVCSAAVMRHWHWCILLWIDLPTARIKKLLNLLVRNVSVYMVSLPSILEHKRHAALGWRRHQELE